MATRAIDFSDLGGKPVQATPPASGKNIDFSDLGGKVVQAAPPPETYGSTGFEAYGEPLQTAEGRAAQTQTLKNLAPAAAGTAASMAGGPWAGAGAYLATKGLVSPEEIKEHPIQTAIETAAFPALEYGGQWLMGLRAARAAARAAQASPPIPNEVQINNLLGVKATQSAVRVGSTGEITVSPGQILDKYISPEKLTAMDPAHRVGFINGVKTEVGTQLAKTYEASSETLDLATPLRRVLNNIGESDLQTAANKQLTKILSDTGIANPASVTPTEAWKLRQALDAAGPDFRLGLVKDTRGTVFRSLRGAVSDALNDAVPEGKQLGRDYGGLVEADKAARQMVRKAAVTLPEPPEPAPTPLSRLGQIARNPYVKTVATVGAGYGLKTLRDLLGNLGQ